jgi:hypothetical protein
VALTAGSDAEGASAMDPARLLLHPGEAIGGEVCTCDRALMANTWCAACGVGYVGGTPVCSAMLFEALDAHGHEIMPSAFECPTCQAALACDGFCDECRFGFVDERLYFSRLTWLLAQGEVRPAVALGCPEHGRSEWCGSCGRGAVGNVVFDDPVLYASAAREQQRLLDSIDTIPRCELCATAMFMGAQCTRCGYDYRFPAQEKAKGVDPPHAMR